MCHCVDWRRAKILVFCRHKHGWNLSRGLLKNIPWFHANTSHLQVLKHSFELWSPAWQPSYPLATPPSSSTSHFEGQVLRVAWCRTCFEGSCLKWYFKARLLDLKWISPQLWWLLLISLQLHPGAFCFSQIWIFLAVTCSPKSTLEKKIDAMSWF